MFKSTLSILIATTLMSCGGGGGGVSSNSTPDTAQTRALTVQLSTGKDISDNAAQWDCSGSDGTAPVTFVQRLFADGTGQAVSRSLDEDGIPLSVTDSFTWSAASANSYQLTFPGEAAFSINNVSVTTINSANDQYDATDSRDNSALNCQKSSTEPVSPTGPVGPVDPGPSDSNVLIQRLTTGTFHTDASESWACLTSDNATANIYFWTSAEGAVYVTDGSDIDIRTFSWQVNPNTAVLTLDGDETVATFSSNDDLILDFTNESANCTRSTSQPIALLLLTGNNSSDVDSNWQCTVDSGGVISSTTNNFFWADDTFASVTATRAPLLWRIGDNPTTVLAAVSSELFTDVSFRTVDNFTAKNLLLQDTNCERSSVQPIADVLETGIGFGDNAFQWDCDNGFQSHRFWSDGEGQLVESGLQFSWFAIDQRNVIQYTANDANSTVVLFEEVNLTSLSSFDAIFATGSGSRDSFSCNRNQI